MPNVRAPVLEKVHRDISEAFEQIRHRVRRECWDDLPDDPDAPDQVGLTLSVSVSAEGEMIASGVEEERGRSRKGLARCLGPLVHALEIPPPGQNVSTTIRVEVP